MIHRLRRHGVLASENWGEMEEREGSRERDRERGSGRGERESARGEGSRRGWERERAHTRERVDR